MPSISSISGIGGIQRPDFANPLGGAERTQDTSFRSLLEQSIKTVATQEAEAGKAVEQFINGDQEDTHKTMLAVQRADLAFEMFVQVRNKVVQAYQEVMRMPE